MIPYLECPCCGDEGATPDADGNFYDGQPLICGCAGMVSVDEDGVYIALSDDPCPESAICQREDQ